MVFGEVFRTIINRLGKLNLLTLKLWVIVKTDQRNCIEKLPLKIHGLRFNTYKS